jgi:RimJ/RimL family protein N-acetyltransferase
MIHATQPCHAGLAGLRDLEERDIDTIVAYWHGGGADLAFLGIDTVKMGEPAATRRRHRARLRTGDKAQKSMAYAIALNGAMIGYTQLNQYDGGVGYSHWHIIDSRVRAGGISSALYPYRIKMYFETSNIGRLVHQTRTRNVGVNRMLDKFVPVGETLFVEKLDGLAVPGEFHIRYVHRADVPRLFEIAAQRAQ